MKGTKFWKRAPLLLLALLCVAPIFVPQKASAAFNLTLSPLPISLKAKPGETVKTPLSVQNTGTEPVKLKVSLMKFGASGTSGEPQIEDPSPNDAYIKWVTFSKQSFVAEPGVMNTIDMTIKVPRDAAFGYYYAAVFNQDTTGNDQPVESENKVTGAVASLVLLDVQAPGSKRELQVTSFASDKKLYQYVPASFTVTVKNTGNTHAIPQGNIFVSRKGSNEFIGTLSINQEQGNILPNSTRKYTAEWNDGFPNYQIKRQNNQIVSDDEGKPVRELNWDFGNANKLRFGQYEASMTLIYDNGVQDVPITGNVSFWVIPWVPVLIILVILLFVGFGIFMMVRGIIRRARGIGRKQKATKNTPEA